MRREVIVEKDAVAAFPRSLLQRQRDQITKTAIGQCVLIGEEPIIRIQPDVRPALHRFGQNVGPKFPSHPRRNGVFKEKPDMPAVARAGSFQIRGQILVSTCLKESLGIFLPVCFVEISSQEETGFVQQHWVDAHDKIPSIVVLTGEMPANDIVGDSQETSVRALGALNSWLFAYALNPFVGADRRVSRFPGLSALKTTRIDVVSSTEKGTEKGDLGRWQRLTINRISFLIQWDIELLEDYCVVLSGAMVKIVSDAKMPAMSRMLWQERRPEVGLRLRAKQIRWTKMAEARAVQSEYRESCGAGTWP